MTLQVVIRPLAELDLIDAQQWYEERRSGLGAEFRAEVDEAMGRIARAPLVFPVVYRGVRRAVLRRFPYLVYFVASSERASVLAFLHMARSPQILRDRAAR